jgi:methylglutamate dehydrogenase subunit D
VADFDWTPRSAVAVSDAATGRLGRQDGRAGIVLRELTGFDLALVASRRGMSGDLASAFASAFATSLPVPGRTVQAGAATVVWSGPDQYLVVASRQDAALAGQLSQRLGAPASVSDQSDARCLLAISGPRVLDALAKLVSVDLDEVAFPAGAVAATSA